MGKLTSRERLIRTFEGRKIDRIATFDIIHNIEMIEHLTGKKITPRNAEDLLCHAASKVLDLIRHFTVPDYYDSKIIKDKDGFIYKYEWWTGHLVERPVFASVEDVAEMIERDIENIYECIEDKKTCDAASMNVNLFSEKYDTFEEIKSEYKRISEKLQGTVMLAPEGIYGIQIPQVKYGYKWWSYLLYDMEETAIRYLDALVDYELAFIESFADFDMCPIAASTGPVGTDTQLLYPPEFFREIVIPRKKKTMDKWKKYGVFHMSFLDGYKWPILDDFIKLGTDAIFPFEPYAGMEVKKFRKLYPETVIAQPVDCTQLLPFGRQDQVRKAVREAISDAGERKIIIGSTSEIHPKVNYMNAIAMYEEARNYNL